MNPVYLINMPVCEICGMEVADVYDCIECKSLFCEECGDLKAKLCYDCVGWEDDLIEEWTEDNLN